MLLDRVGKIADRSVVGEMRWGGVKENDEEPPRWMGHSGLAGLAGACRTGEKPLER